MKSCRALQRCGRLGGKAPQSWVRVARKARPLSGCRNVSQIAWIVACHVRHALERFPLLAPPACLPGGLGYVRYLCGIVRCQLEPRRVLEPFWLKALRGSCFARPPTTCISVHVGVANRVRPWQLVAWQASKLAPRTRQWLCSPGRRVFVCLAFHLACHGQNWSRFELVFPKRATRGEGAVRTVAHRSLGRDRLR